MLAAFGKQKDVHPFGSADEVARRRSGPTRPGQPKAPYGQDKPSSPAPVRGFIPQPVVEPLSERELDVLRLLGTELNGPEIARRLMVSLNTIRTHTKNIYNKLGVNNRRAAVRRAEELDLL